MAYDAASKPMEATKKRTGPVFPALERPDASKEPQDHFFCEPSPIYNHSPVPTNHPTETHVTAAPDQGMPTGEVFFKIKYIFFGYFDPINILFDNKNK